MDRFCSCSSGYRCVLLTMLFPYYDVFYRPIKGLDTIDDDSCKLEFDQPLHFLLT